ncbi:MAG: MMPL family transporter [Bacteroidales bacterium]|nr:MMPL family transporter [Bacteroidales bacterium]
MTDFFLHIYDFLKKRRGFCFVLLAAVMAALVLMTLSLKYNENIWDFLPAGDNRQKAITLYQDISGGQRVVAMFRLKDPTSSESSLTDAVDTFSRRVMEGSGRKHITSVESQIDFDRYAGITDFVYRNIPLMLSDSDYVRMENLLSSPLYVDEQLEADVGMIMMPATGFFTSSIGSDPLSLFSPVIRRLQESQLALPYEFDDGYIYTPGKGYAIALVSSPYGAMESANNNQLVSYLDSVARQTMEASPDVDLAFTGAPVISVDNARRIKSDSKKAISIAVTLILILLILAFRRVKSLMLIGLAILFGWLFAMGFIAALRNDVSLIVLGIGSIIIGIAVNYPLHFVAHTDHGGSVRQSLKEMVAPLLIGNITTVGAFAALMPLDAPALRDLGFFAAFMLIGTIIFVLVFLPHLVKKRAGKEKLLFRGVSSFSPERKKWLLWVVLALTVFFGYFSFGTSFDTDMNRINYLTPKQKQLLEGLGVQAGVNDTSNIYLVAEGKTWDQALERRMAMAPLLDSLKSKGVIDGFSSATGFIAPKGEQKRRIDLWNAFWNEHKEEVLSTLDSRASRYGFSEEAFSSFRRLIAEDYSAKPFEHFDTLRQAVLGNSFSASGGNFSVVDVVKAQDIGKACQILGSSLGDRGYAFDFAGMNSSIARGLSDDFNYIGFACGLIVFIFLWLSFGRLELTLIAFLPMAMGWFWILGIMNLLGLQFNIVNVILATFIFGQGDDYTIFITEGLIDEFAYGKKVLASFKNSIIISALIMFIGMGSLIVARHPALHSLAEVTIVGMLSVVFMAWIVPPVLFSFLVSHKGKPHLYPLTFGQIFARKSEGNATKDSHSFHRFVICKYIYKGYAVERETRRLLKRYDDFSEWVDRDIPQSNVSVINAGKGQFSLMMALVHPEIEVHSYCSEQDDAALLSAISPKPANLHVHCVKDGQAAMEAASGTHVINLSEILD